MIIRVIAKNIFSFKETTEFNTLTSSKIRELPHHKLKKGKWKRRRTDITASIGAVDSNTNGFIYVECNKEQELLKTKSKKRRRVSVEKKCPDLISVNDKLASWSIIDNKIYSFHQLVNFNVSKDFYDMPND